MKAPDVIKVYVCPECGSWSGSSTYDDLVSKQNLRTSMRNLATEDPEEWSKPVGNRGECQHCKQRGKDVQRIEVTYWAADTVSLLLEQKVDQARQQEEAAERKALQEAVTLHKRLGYPVP